MKSGWLRRQSQNNNIWTPIFIGTRRMRRWGTRCHKWNTNVHWSTAHAQLKYEMLQVKHQCSLEHGACVVEVREQDHHCQNREATAGAGMSLPGQGCHYRRRDACQSRVATIGTDRYCWSRDARDPCHSKNVTTGETPSQQVATGEAGMSLQKGHWANKWPRVKQAGMSLQKEYRASKWPRVKQGWYCNAPGAGTQVQFVPVHRGSILLIFTLWASENSQNEFEHATEARWNLK